jgi:hypothetical protein
MDQELKQYLGEMEARLGGGIGETNRRVAEIEARLGETSRSMAEMEARLIERMTEIARDMQTELLRGIAAYSESTSIRMRKLEADQSNLDAALAGRMAIMEKRLFEIEQRLGGMTH